MATTSEKPIPVPRSQGSPRVAVRDNHLAASAALSNGRSSSRSPSPARRVSPARNPSPARTVTPVEMELTNRSRSNLARIEGGVVVPTVQNGNEPNIIMMDGVPTVVPDVNIYQNRKTLAKGMMDLALLSANGNQLRYVLESQSRHPFFYFSLIFITFSLVVQVAVGVGLILNSRYNIKDKKEICKANKINNYVVLGIFLITFINVFVSVFGVADPPPAPTQTPISVPTQAAPNQAPAPIPTQTPIPLPQQAGLNLALPPISTQTPISVPAQGAPNQATVPIPTQTPISVPAQAAANQAPAPIPTQTPISVPAQATPNQAPTSIPTQPPISVPTQAPTRDPPLIFV